MILLEKIKNLWLSLLYLMLLIIIIVSLFIINKNYKKNVLKESIDKLIALNEIKTKRIQSWLDQQKTNALTYANSPFFIETLKQHNTDLIKLLNERCEIIKKYKNYYDVYVLDDNKKLISGTSSEVKLFNIEILEKIKKDSVIFTGIYKHENNWISDLITPIYQNEKLIGYFIINLKIKDELVTRFENIPQIEGNVKTFLLSIYDYSSFFYPSSDLKYSKEELKKVLSSKKDYSIYKNNIITWQIIAGLPYILFSQIKYRYALQDYYKFRNISLITALFLYLLIIIILNWIFALKEKNLLETALKNELLYRQEQERFKTIFYNIGDGVIATDNKGYVLKMNYTAEKLTGYSEIEAKNKHIKEIFNIVNEKTFEIVPNPIEKALEKPGVYYLENNVLLISKNKHFYLIDDCASSIVDENNKISGAILVFRDKTSEKLLTRQLEASEEKLRKAELKALIGHWEYDIDTRDIFISEGLKKIINTERNYFRYDEVSKIVLPEYFEKIKQGFKFLLENKIPLESELKIKRFDDNKIIDIYLEADFKEKNIFGIVKDITEQKLYIEELKKKEVLFHNLFTDAPMPKLIIDPYTGAIIEANKSASLFYGYPIVMLKKMNFKDLCIDKDDISEKLIEILNKNLTVLNLQQKLADNSIRDIELFVGPIYIEGNLYLYATITDVTEEFKVRKKLIESEERFKMIFKTSPDAIAILKYPEGIFIDVNDAFEIITGYNKNEVIGKSTEEIDLWDNIYDKNRLLDELKKNKVVTNFETKFKLKNGNTGYGLLSVNILHMDGENYVIVIGRGITERKKMEEELRIAKEKAEESDKMKTAFLHNISHEIRTPLNGIIGFADLLKNKDLTDDKKEKYLNIIIGSAYQLLGIVNDVIEISKIEVGNIPLHNTIFNINEVCDELHILFSKKANEDILFKVNKEFIENVIIETDKEKLKQILSGLLNNAFKYTEKGEIEFGYNIIDNSLIKFYVRDTGIGIPESEREKIFERFYRGVSKEHQKYGGSGLGLSIAKGLIEAMGGKIWVESTPGIGSCFYFTIPIKLYPTTKLESPEKIEKLDLTGLKILIAEDEPVNFEYLRIILSAYNAEIIWAKNGAEVIEKIPQHMPDIILMDIKMPVMDGIEATKILKSMYPDIIIVAQTAYSADDEEYLARKAGCDYFITKPIKKENLINLLLLIKNKFK